MKQLKNLFILLLDWDAMEFQLRIVVLAVLCGVTVWAEKARFDNYRVYSIRVENKEQLSALKKIENNPDGVKISAILNESKF